MIMLRARQLSNMMRSSLLRSLRPRSGRSSRMCYLTDTRPNSNGRSKELTWRGNWLPQNRRGKTRLWRNRPRKRNPYLKRRTTVTLTMKLNVSLLRYWLKRTMMTRTILEGYSHLCLRMRSTQAQAKVVLLSTQPTAVKLWFAILVKQQVSALGELLKKPVAQGKIRYCHHCRITLLTETPEIHRPKSHIPLCQMPRLPTAILWILFGLNPKVCHRQQLHQTLRL